MMLPTPAIARRPIGRTGLFLPELGFGASALGNLYEPMSDGDAQAALDTAMAAGLCYVDTAPHYGRGLSERRVGDALRLRPDVIVSTKVGRVLDPDPMVTDDRERDGFRSPMPFRARYDYTHDGILRSHEHSLQRLGLARIDLLYVHDIGRRTHGNVAPEYWEQLTTGGGLKALERLREEGSIAGFGVGVNEVQACLEVMAISRLDVLLLAGRYTLLEQEALDTLFPACRDAGTLVVIGGPYNSGILATGTRSGARLYYNYAPAPDHIVARIREIELIADRHDVPLAAAALAFVLAHPVVASVVPGLNSVDQVRHTCDLYRRKIPEAFWAELKERNLLRGDAPVPFQTAG